MAEAALFLERATRGFDQPSFLRQGTANVGFFLGEEDMEKRMMRSPKIEHASGEAFFVMPMVSPLS